MPVSNEAGTGILRTWRRGGLMGMKSRGIAAGLCICLTFSLAGCGKQTPDASDFVISRTQEEAREEVRRHIEQEEKDQRKKMQRVEIGRAHV